MDFAAVARGCGYRATALCQGMDGLASAMDWAAQESGQGPILLHVSVDEAEASGLERPSLSPAEIASAFRASVGGE